MYACCTLGTSSLCIRKRVRHYFVDFISACSATSRACVLEPFLQRCQRVQHCLFGNVMVSTAARTHTGRLDSFRVRARSAPRACVVERKNDVGSLPPRKKKGNSGTIAQESGPFCQPPPSPRANHGRLLTSSPSAPRGPLLILLSGRPYLACFFITICVIFLPSDHEFAQ